MPDHKASKAEIQDEELEVKYPPEALSLMTVKNPIKRD